MPHHRLATLAALLASASLLVGACAAKSKDKEPSTCGRLQAQLAGCTTVSQSVTEEFATFCSTAPDTCRECLDGRLCGDTKLCDTACGRTIDAGTSSPSCDVLQGQLNACPNVAQSAKRWFGAFCAAASADCRSCLNDQLCAVTDPCASLCGSGADASGT